MKKTIFLIIILSFVFAGSALAESSPEGLGTKNDPYLIRSIADLDWLVDEVNNKNNSFSGKHIKLENDIDASNWVGVPIGTLTSPFDGSFDGNFHVIRNLRINDPTLYYAGLFGHLDANSRVSNLGLENVNIIGGNYVGGLAGKLGGKLSGVYVTGVVSSSDQTGSRVGGLIGTAGYGDISDAYSIVTVSGGMVGGIAGEFTGNNQVSNTYWNVDIAGNDGVGYDAGGSIINDLIGKTTSEMQTTDFATILTVNSVAGVEWSSEPGTNDSYPIFKEALSGTPPVDSGNGNVDESVPVSQEVSVLGNVYATVLDFTVPLEVTFVIDPNQENPEERFISPVLNVHNVTNAPVKVSIASFEMTQESINKGFQSVAPTLYSNEEWSNLNKVDSKKLAVGIRANNNWEILDNASTLYANTFEDELIGTIGASDSANFVFEAKHGNAFNKAVEIKYLVSFVIELG